MSKVKTAFFCSNCGYESAKWTGKCPSCNNWNTFIEEVIQKDTGKKDDWKELNGTPRDTKIIALQNVESSTQERLITPDPELNRVLGGGIVPGSIVLIAGEPGIGKSTLFLQIGLLMHGTRVLYVSGEESEQQIKMRADRLNIKHSEFYLLTETSTQSIFKELKKIKPELLIIDSIQTLQSNYIDSSPGSISQIRECAAELQRFAKESNIPVFMIGHITKDGAVAGPKILEHMVDTVLQFEGDRHYAYRILRTIKNRFGSASELGIYEMTNDGMRGVNNPSEILITQKEEQLSGIAIAASMEGMRPLLIEVQALVTQSVYGTPQRTVSGFDLRRLQLLLAVLEKRGGFHFGMKDVFLNIAGGLKVEDPSIDLAVLSALLSSFEDVPLPQQICFAGEVGLSGEIRAVNRIEQRIAEADKLGFEKIIVSKYNLGGGRNGQSKLNTKQFGIEVIEMSRVEELYKYLFNSVVNLLYPRLCLGCGSDLISGKQVICLDCIDALPVTNFHLHRNNPVEKIFMGRIAVEHVSAYTYFNKQSVMQNLLHQLKYKGKKEIGLYFGRRMGEAFGSSERYKEIEGLVPLPLFFKRERKRGYNQAAMICEGISEVMGLPVLNNVIVRKRSTQTQTHKNRAERWENIEGKFELINTEKLEGKHVLLVDDVLTTGATLEACGSELLKARGLKLSIATLAYTSL